MKRKLKKTVCMSLVGVMTFTSIWGNDVTTQAASKPKKITMNKKKVTLEAGKTFKLKVKKVTPKKASKAVTYKSSKKKVATVNKKGVIKGKSAGTAKITVTSKKNKKVKAKVTVTVKKKQAITPSTSSAPVINATPAASGNPIQSANPSQSTTPAESTKPTESTKPEESSTPTQSAEPVESSTPTQSAKPEESSTPIQSANPDVSTAPTPVPTPTIRPTFAPSTQNYDFFNDYTLGWSDGIVAYKDGKKVSLEDAGAEVYNKKTDNIFAQHIANNNWYDDKIMLTPPIQYTTSDGVAHNVGSMLTNFDFIADPT